MGAHNRNRVSEPLRKPVMELPPICQLLDNITKEEWFRKRQEDRGAHVSRDSVLICSVHSAVIRDSSRKSRQTNAGQETGGRRLQDA